MKCALLVCAGAAVALSPAPPARADVSAATPGAFVSTFRDEVKAAPDVVWKAIVQLPRWWSGQHTYSGQAVNLSLDVQAGGCWCERAGNGLSVQHGTVVMVQPGRAIRVFANLGPLQDLPLHGVLTIATAAQDGKTVLRMIYRVAGDASAALDQLAPAVDQVMGAQFRRLKALAETGQAD